MYEPMDKIEKQNFYTTVYAILKEVPEGRVVTYGMLARLAGQPNYARWVGRAMAEVPEHLSLPAHRVVNSHGRTAPHWNDQRALLEKEGVGFRPNGCVDLARYRWDIFSSQPLD